MAERWNIPHYGSLPTAGDVASSPLKRGTITLDVGPASSAKRVDKIEPSLMVLASLTDLPVDPTNSRRTIAGSPHFAGPEVSNLLDPGSAGESFLYENPENDYVAPEQRLAESEYSTDEIEQAPGPLLQFEVGVWTIPVMLSGAAVSR